MTKVISSTYELVLIFRSQILPKTAEEVLKEFLSEFKGKVEETKIWGKKELSSPIKKETEGLCLFSVVKLDPGQVSTLKEKIRMHQDILRFLLVKRR